MLWNRVGLRDDCKVIKMNECFLVIVTGLALVTLICNLFDL